MEKETSDQPKRLRLIAGVDEASYGSWIGKVWAGAVILNPDRPIQGLNDSKKLTTPKRADLFNQIKINALAYGIGFATAQEIDQMGVFAASHLAMTRALNTIEEHHVIDKILLDGNKTPKWKWPTETIVKGDSKIQEIMAASILAKHSRTLEMIEMDQRHPHYAFASNQGYGTASHQEALKKYGILEEHRKSYKPIAKIIEEAQSKESKKVKYNR